MVIPWYSSNMKRFFFGVSAVVLTVVGLPFAQAGAQNTSNFTISSFNADYYLDKDAEGRATLKTIERIVAVFPSYDQNHGIERAIPLSYDGHSTHLSVQSIVDTNGKALPYTTSSSNDNLVVRIGQANTYVHGTTAYVITYTQRDVTRFFADTNDDEFYWDVNGTQWPQAIQRVSTNVHIGDRIADKLTNKASCYQGKAGSDTRCTIFKQNIPGETVYMASAGPFGPNENMTVAIGFRPHTFTAYQAGASEKFWATAVTTWIIIGLIEAVMAAGFIIWMSIRRRRIMNRSTGRGTIIPEYLPPKDTSVLQSAVILGSTRSDSTAQLLDLAVRHYLKIYQTKEKSLLRPAEYELEIIKDCSDLLPEEQALLKLLFNETLTVGDRFNTSNLRGNVAISRQLLQLHKTLRADTRSTYALFEKAESEAKLFKRLGVAWLAVGLATLSPFGLLAAIMALVFAATLWPMTEKGVRLKEYLAGLKMYVSVAEEERIKMLQSPEGAEKIGGPLQGNEPALLVKLYERVLPYAVLFGIEKEWIKQLGNYYETSATQPDWYGGQGAFNAVMFNAGLSGFHSQMASYSSSTSSSSGGASGGGSSGDGGGGGGGGGW